MRRPHGRRAGRLRSWRATRSVVVQEPQQLGTGDAVNAAREAMTADDVRRLSTARSSVLSGDCPLITARNHSPRSWHRCATQNDAAVVVLTMKHGRPHRLRPHRPRCATGDRSSASSSRRTPRPKRLPSPSATPASTAFDAPTLFDALGPRVRRQRPGRVLPHRRAGDLPQRRPPRCWRSRTDDAAESHGRELAHPAGPGHQGHAAPHQRRAIMAAGVTMCRPRPRCGLALM